MEKVRQEVIDCADQQECLAKVTVEISKDIQILPKQMTDEVAKIDSNLSALKPNATSCGETFTAQYKVNGTVIFDRIVSCIKTKINS